MNEKVSSKFADTLGHQLLTSPLLCTAPKLSNNNKQNPARIKGKKFCFAETNYMILKTLMEEKQLDFNQPLLSVRRFSSTVVASESDSKRKTNKSSAPKLPPLPVYKSELKSGPVSNPGTVPFVWEKSPGRPKEEGKSETLLLERHVITPKLPPGRASKVEQKDSDKVPKATLVTQSGIGSSISSSQSCSSSDNKVTTKHESIKEIIQEKTSSGSDDGDEIYQDAIDTLSRTESFFMTCSISGLSAWDEQEVQPSTSFSADQQARDFMIGRFLPAAKAMASETSQVQYTSKKPVVMKEQPRLVKKVVNGEKPRPLNPKWQNVMPHYAQNIGREESEYESDDNDIAENFAPKVCGLFPRFCLLNPMPGLRMEDRILNSPVHRMHGASQRTTAKRHTGTANYGKSLAGTQSGFTKEKDSAGIPEKSNHVIDPHRRGCSEFSSAERTRFESICESPVVEKTLYVDSVRKVKSSTSCSSEIKGQINQVNQRRDNFKTSRKDSVIDKNPTINSSLEDCKPVDIADEKTTLTPESLMSLDSSRLLCSDNSSNNMKVEIENNSNTTYLEKEGLTKTGYKENNLDHELVVTSSQKIIGSKQTESQSRFPGSKRSCKDQTVNPMSQKNLKLTGDSEVDLKIHGATESVDQECAQSSSQDDNNTLASLNMASDGKMGLERKLLTCLGCRETSNANSAKTPLALPLPKAPSESWLKRTLPAVSSRNLPTWSNVATSTHARTQTSKTALADPKWEIIVKSSNVHHGQLRLAEEPLPPIPEA
ncbi:uncharacterized protein LOC107630026 isoform X1 [Arachis ipaensis]|nr:uncharacterized protein LOC107630026 isoform X1 [Arachis ipaensis]XP_025643639.1 uncharacterized protein LOC112737771 isoform X1 [Arachis hypogaea]QHO00456.1 uncharacterized protein DS421_13g406700 [Arachis hypogaea]